MMIDIMNMLHCVYSFFCGGGQDCAHLCIFVPTNFDIDLPILSSVVDLGEGGGGQGVMAVSLFVSYDYIDVTLIFFSHAIPSRK